MKTPVHKFKILFLCTWNSSRSIFAEYFMKDIGVDRFEAFSAGVTPKGQVFPITLKVLRRKIDDGYARRLIHTVRGVGFVLKEGATG